MPLPVTIDDVREALPRVQAVLPPTPLHEWPGLSELVGARVFVKHENAQPVGAFKVRGGINLVATLTDAERRAGLLGCSTGNHGQSLAFAARRFGVACKIVVPVGTNPGKVAAIRRLGAEVQEHGRDFDEAREYVERELASTGPRYVHSANEPKLIAGVGTMALEVFDDLPEPDAILVPIGLGSGVCGTAIVAKGLRPATEVIGVQSESAPAGTLSWRAGEPVTTETAATWAEGIATRSSAEMTRTIMRELMDDALLVDDDELRRACRWLLEHAHTLAEGAGAATLAAAYRYRERFRGRTIVCVLSGGNLDLAELPRILAAGDPP